jgi:hypothetical protein
MHRVRRLIHRTNFLPRTKDQNVETRDPLEPLIQIDSVNKPYVKLPVLNTPYVKSPAVNSPPVKLEQAPRKLLTDYVFLAIKAAKALNKNTSLEHIDKVAKDLFKFDIDPHLQIIMPDVIAQEIFDWIITLKERPMREQERLKLARKFIAILDSENTPVEKPDVL